MKPKKSGEGKYWAYKYTYMESSDYCLREDYNENGDMIARNIYETDNKRLTNRTMIQKLEEGNVIKTFTITCDDAGAVASSMVIEGDLVGLLDSLLDDGTDYMQRMLQANEIALNGSIVDVMDIYEGETVVFDLPKDGYDYEISSETVDGFISTTETGGRRFEWENTVASNGLKSIVLKGIDSTGAINYKIFIIKVRERVIKPLVKKSDEPQHGVYYTDEISDLRYSENNNESNVEDYYIISAENFNVDNDGFPETPMLLEIAYTDSIDISKICAITNDNKGRYYAQVAVRTDYNCTDDVLHNAYSADGKKTVWDTVAGLGDRGRGEKRVFQYLFDKTLFQGLKAITNPVTGEREFKIRIRLPKKEDGTYDEGLTLDIDSIALRSISISDSEDFKAAQRERLGFFEVDLGTDEPVIPVDYADKTITIFQRDLMQPIYHHTKPSQEEIDIDLKSTSFRGEIEALNFGIYSEEGVEGLTFKVSDLVSESNSIIQSKNIDLSRISYEYKQLQANPNRREYALLPDALMPIDEPLSIDAESSARICLKIRVSDEQAGGVYRGTVTVYNGEDKYEISVSLEVIPMKLDAPNNINPIYRDPYNKTLSTSTEEVNRFYADIGLSAFWHVKPEDFFEYNKDGNVVDCNMGVFEYDKSGNVVSYMPGVFGKKLEKMQDEGALGEKVLVETDRIFEDVLEWAGIIYWEEEDLYENLSATEFVDKFSKIIENIIEIGKYYGISFIFSASDEPGRYAKKRIIAERLFTIIRSVGGETTATYHQEACDEEILSGIYKVPDGDGLYTANGSIAPLGNLVTYKIWFNKLQDSGYEQEQEKDETEQNFGYYTTFTSHLRYPVYNRFSHGLLAVATNADIVSAYAMGDIIGDPFNDFDQNPGYMGTFTYPDFVMAYPTWSGDLIPTMNAEGLREGIKDAKYIATLKRLIEENPGDCADEASEYLNSVVSKISTEYYNDYVDNGTDKGFMEPILADISENGNSTDFDAFSAIREKITDYIIEMTKTSEVV